MRVTLISILFILASCDFIANEKPSIEITITNTSNGSDGKTPDMDIRISNTGSGDASNVSGSIKFYVGSSIIEEKVFVYSSIDKNKSKNKSFVLNQFDSHDDYDKYKINYKYYDSRDKEYSKKIDSN